jgi:hypothetical protein
VLLNDPLLYNFLLYLASRQIKLERNIILHQQLSFWLSRRNKSLLKQIHSGKSSLSLLSKVVGTTLSPEFIGWPKKVPIEA